jgi:peptide/nickel transport system ATP-binding protein
MPTIEKRLDVLIPIEGSPPSLLHPPSGCPFHPRCPDVMAGSCDRTEPALVGVAPGQAVSCLLYPPA